MVADLEHPVETLADLSRLRVNLLGETPARPLDIRPGFDPIALLRGDVGLPPSPQRAVVEVRMPGWVRPRKRIYGTRRDPDLVAADLEWAWARPPWPIRVLRRRRRTAGLARRLWVLCGRPGRSRSPSVY